MIKRIALLWTSWLRRLSAQWIVAIYLLFGMVWITIFEQVIGATIYDAATQVTLNMLAGWAFIIVTTLFLYRLIRLHTADLRASERKYRTLVEAADDGILLTDLQGHHLFANDAYYTSLGYEPADAKVPDGFSAVPPDDAPYIKEKMSELLAQGHLTTEYRVRHKNGQWRHRFAKATLIYDDAHHPISILAIVRDMTERRQVEEQINALAKFPSENPNPVLRVTQTGIVEYANPASTTVLKGWSSASGQPLPPHWITIIQETLKSGLPREEELIVEGQSFSLSLAPIVSNTYVNVYGQDITERKRAEAQQELVLEALRESEDKFKYVFDHSLVGKSITYPNGEMHVNQAFCEMVGYTPEELKHQAWPKITHPDDVEANQKTMEALLSGEIGAARFIKRYLHKTGSIVWADVTTSLRRDKAGHPLYLMTAVNDITELKQIEAQREAALEAVRESEKRYRLLVDAIPNISLHLFDQEHRFLIAGGEEIAKSGFDKNLIEGHTLAEVYPADVVQLFGPLYDKALRGQSSFFEHAYGDFVYHQSVIPVYDQHGNIYAGMTLSQNITEHKRNEQALQQREQYLRTILQTALDGYWLVDRHGRFQEVNEAYCAMSGYTRAELLQMSIADVESAETEMQIATHIQRIVDQGADRFETRHRRKDGTVRDVEVSVNFQPEAGGQLTCFLRDITQRKRDEAALRASESRYRELVQNANSAIIRWRNDGTILFFNEYAQTLFGYTAAEVVGKHINLLVPEQESTGNDLTSLVQSIVADPQQFVNNVNENICKDGRRVWMAWTNKPIHDAQGQVTEILAVGVDISDRKRAEEKLRESEERFRSLYENSTIGLYRTTPAGQILLANPTLIEILGYPSFDALATRNLEAVGFEPSYARVHFMDLVEREGEVKGLESAWQRRDGTTIFISESARAIRDAQGKTRYYDGTIADITARKQAEEEIIRLNATLEQRVAERTAELSDLYNNAPCGYHSLDSDGVFVHVNDTELKWLGYTREELIGKMKATDILTPASIETFKINFPIFKDRGWLQDLELEMVRKDNSILPVLLSATIVTDQAGRFLMSRSTIIDHTERKRAESQREAALTALQQSQTRLETANKELEAFAYSISHDLRAPLRAIDGFSRIILEEYAQQLDDEARRMFNIVRSNTQKMDQLITDLLALSRVSRSQLTTTRFDMTPLVDEVYRTIASPDDLQSCTLTVAPLLEARGDPVLLRQVWVNLLANALKYTRPKTERRIEVGSLAQELEHVYYVKDNGVGFNPEYAHKLFGIFQRLHAETEFEGTGVGLAIVQRIIQRHGGHVWAAGQLDQGATFYFSLPDLEADNE